MFGIDFSEAVIILAVAIIVIGPKDIPRLVRGYLKLKNQVTKFLRETKHRVDAELQLLEAEKNGLSAELSGLLKEAGQGLPLQEVKIAPQNPFTAVPEVSGVIRAPFTAQQVLDLMHEQVGEDPQRCPAHEDRQHMRAGGGVLSPTSSGMHCPVCGHTAPWAYGPARRGAEG